MKNDNAYLPISEWDEKDQPREKLIKQGADALTDSELIGIILRIGHKGKSAVDLAKSILKQFTDLEGLERSGIQELASIKGVGPAKAASLKAVVELAKRMASKPIQSVPAFCRPAAVYNHFRYRLRNKQEEYFYTLLLNRKNQLISENMVSKGTLTASAVHPREVLKLAIKESAASFIAVHNHPSGDTEPSRDDLEITRKLLDSAEIIGIQMLDHIIIGYDSYTSLFEQYPEFR